MTPNPMQGESLTNPNTSNDIRDYQANAEEALRSAKQQLSDVMDTISERAREYGRYADEQVQQNPWAAVGVGFGAGLIMGALLTIVARR
jgi:ElaB/YqjD/DUF883 family membrane-anchored ribosome-binding protein